MKISKLAYFDVFLAIRETLKNRGVFGHLKAQVHAEIFQALGEQGEPCPQLSNENMLINELIREYLLFNNYCSAESVLVTGNARFSGSLYIYKE